MISFIAKILFYHIIKAECLFSHDKTGEERKVLRISALSDF